MKWNINSTIQKIKGKFSKLNPDQDAAHFETGKKLYNASQYEEALFHLDNAISLGVYDDAYKLKGNCLQKLDYHYNAIEDFDKAIETNPLEFSNYYSRAISKKAILDFTGQIEDLHNAIYYYKNNTVLESSILRTFETDLLTARMNIEALVRNASEITRAPSIEIKSLIKDSLLLIRKVKLKKAILK